MLSFFIDLTLPVACLLSWVQWLLFHHYYSVSRVVFCSSFFFFKSYFRHVVLISSPSFPNLKLMGAQRKPHPFQLWWSHKNLWGCILVWCQCCQSKCADQREYAKKNPKKQNIRNTISTNQEGFTHRIKLLTRFTGSHNMFLEARVLVYTVVLGSMQALLE